MCKAAPLVLNCVGRGHKLTMMWLRATFVLGDWKVVTWLAGKRGSVTSGPLGATYLQAGWSSQAQGSKVFAEEGHVDSCCNRARVRFRTLATRAPRKCSGL